MFVSSTLEASVFMGKKYSTILHFIRSTGNNLTLKQMFDIYEKLIVGQSDGIFGVTQSQSGHPVFRDTSPLSRGPLRSKGGGKLSIHFCADEGTIETVFRTIISVNQLSIYGAVSNLCEECKTCHVRTGRPVVAGQSIPLFVPSVMTTPTLSIEVLAQEGLLQKYKERVERLSQQNRVIKCCTDAGFLKPVEVGQYFMTKDTEEFPQFTEPVTCREYTLPRGEKSSDPKGWIRGTQPASCLQGKYGVEIRIESVNQDNSHSWVRISHGLNKLVTDMIDKKDDDNEQETFCEPIKG